MIAYELSIGSCRIFVRTTVLKARKAQLAKIAFSLVITAKIRSFSLPLKSLQDYGMGSLHSSLIENGWINFDADWQPRSCNQEALSVYIPKSTSIALCSDGRTYVRRDRNQSYRQNQHRIEFALNE